MADELSDVDVEKIIHITKELILDILKNFPNVSDQDIKRIGDMPIVSPELAPDEEIKDRMVTVVSHVLGVSRQEATERLHQLATGKSN